MQEDNIKPINRNKRIAVNTIVSYGRTLLSVCLVCLNLYILRDIIKFIFTYAK